MAEVPLASRPASGLVGSFAPIDEHFMARAIGLAWNGAGRVAPNPMVGAVVTSREGRVLGEGHHAAFGLDHAEAVACAVAGESARDGTLYVTLEPCAHHGNTPPCVERVLESGIRRVVCATLDPDPRTNGAGVGALRRVGIEVTVGCLAERAIALNLPYFKRTLGLPGAITLKMAVTLDGRIASRPGGRDEISGREARRHVHQLRAIHDAVVVGIDTLLVDSPRLDCRELDDVTTPVPVVMDTNLRFPLRYPWIEDGRRFLVVCGRGASQDRVDELSRLGAQVLKSEAEEITIGDLVDALADLGIGSALVEGGASVFTSFVAAKQWDAMHVIMSPVAFGPGGVGLTTRGFAGEEIDAVAIASAPLGGDVAVSFLSRRTRDVLLPRLVRDVHGDHS